MHKNAAYSTPTEPLADWMFVVSVNAFVQSCGLSMKSNQSIYTVSARSLHLFVNMDS